VKLDRVLNKDLLAGLVFLAFGWGAIAHARLYEIGTLMRMGPGWFPAALGVILALFGVFLVARGIGWSNKETVSWGWRPITCIVASMLAFGFLMPQAGLVPALVAMFFVAALAGREFRWREVLVLTLVMTALALGVFVYLLKLPFQLFPGFYLV
jgi:Tripartite tricarboxylate transporter TctB family